MGKKVVRLMIYELQLLHIYIRSAMLNEFGVYKLYRVSYYFEITSFLRDSIIYFFQIFSRLRLFDGLRLLISEKVLKATIISWATTIQ